MTHRGFSGKGTAAQLYNKGGHTDSGGRSISLNPDMDSLLDKDVRGSTRAAEYDECTEVLCHSG